MKFKIPYFKQEKNTTCGVACLRMVFAFYGGNAGQKQKTSITDVERLLIRSTKDLKTAKANLEIDEGIAYSVAYLAMLRAGRAFMLLKGFRPSDGYQHKTAVEFVRQVLGNEYSALIKHFDRMRRKRNLFTYEIDVTVFLYRGRECPPFSRNLCRFDHGTG
ncbi:MAG: hypothetical protein NTX75_04070 [Proteobacteria bacterium]|nr:hypothetical protein [Pseudomonadota bacterium]